MSRGPIQLAQALGRRIQADGPMRLDAFWRAAATSPEGGYYVARQPIGAEGDFTTAPEISQIFGELIGLWLAEAWDRAGQPAPFALIELGPGRGQLMADALRAAKAAPGFVEAARLILVETNLALRGMQEQLLGAYGPEWRDDWRAGLQAAGHMPTFLVANEFLDALPIRQLQKDGDAWRERLVTADDAGGFAFTLGAPQAPPQRDALDLDAAPEGAILEWSPDREALGEAVGAHLADQDGAALFIDYGHGGAKLGDSLQALCDKRPADPLAAPGTADITSHVDFGAFAKVAEIAGARSWGPIDQGVFLLRLGAEARETALCAKATPEAAAAIAQGLRRLVNPLAMGSLFKALALLPAVYPPPAGFEA